MRQRSSWGRKRQMILKNFLSWIPDFTLLTSSTWRANHKSTGSNFQNAGVLIENQFLSFRAPCTCTKQRARLSSFTASERANKELQNAFLDDSQAQKEAEIGIFKDMPIFVIFAQKVVLRATFCSKSDIFWKFISWLPFALTKALRERSSRLLHK